MDEDWLEVLWAVGLATPEWRSVQQQAERDIVAWVLRAEQVGLARAAAGVAAETAGTGGGERRHGDDEAYNRHGGIESGLGIVGALSTVLSMAHRVRCAVARWRAGSARAAQQQSPQLTKRQRKRLLKGKKKNKRGRERGLARARWAGLRKRKVIGEVVVVVTGWHMTGRALGVGGVDSW